MSPKYKNECLHCRFLTTHISELENKEYDIYYCLGIDKQLIARYADGDLNDFKEDMFVFHFKDNEIRYFNQLRKEAINKFEEEEKVKERVNRAQERRKSVEEKWEKR